MALAQQVNMEIELLSKMEPEALKKLAISDLQNLYRAQKAIPTILNMNERRWNQTWDKHYVKLPLVIKPSLNGLENSQVQEYKEIELENIFQSDNSSEICKVLISGVGGAGKSTLLQYICYQWGNEKLWSDKFVAVFNIQLKNLLDSRWKRYYENFHHFSDNKLSCFIHHNLLLQTFKLNCSNFENNIKRIPHLEVSTLLKDKVLLLVEDYSEMSNLSCWESTDVQDIMNEIYKNKYVIMTTRPNAAEISGKIKFDRVLGNKSLNNYNIRQFIHSFYQNRNKVVGKSLRSFVDDNYQVGEVCELPFNLVLLCMAWNNSVMKRHFRRNSDINIHSFYKEIIPWLLKSDDNISTESLISNMFEKDSCKFFLSNAFHAYFEQGDLSSNEMFQEYLSKLLTRDSFARRMFKDFSLQYGGYRFNYRFALPYFQEYFVALYFISKLASNDEQTLADISNSISLCLKENKYLTMLKFLAGMISSPEFHLGISKHVLIQRSWQIFTGVIDDVSEIDLEWKVILLMHLLEQSKVNGDYDQRIPNLDKIITFIDTAVLSNVIKYKIGIIESGYVSEVIKQNLQVAFDDAANEDELKLRAAIEVFSSLAQKCGGRESVFEKLLKVLPVENWKLQKLCLEGMKQLVNSNIAKNIMCNNLLMVISLIRIDSLRDSAIDLLVESVYHYSTLLYNIFHVMESVIKNKPFDEERFSENCNLIKEMSKDDHAKFVNSIFSFLEKLFLKINFLCPTYFDMTGFLFDIIKLTPKCQLRERIDQSFAIFENIIFGYKKHHQRHGVSELLDLLKVIPEEEKLENFDRILILFEKILKGSDFDSELQKEVISSLPKLVLTLPTEIIPEKISQVIDLFEVSILNEFWLKRKNAFRNNSQADDTVDSMTYLIILLPDIYKLDAFVKIMLVIEKALNKKIFSVGPDDNSAIAVVSSLVRNVFANNSQPAEDVAFILYEIFETVIKETNSRKDFRLMMLHGLLELVKAAHIQPLEKVELIDRVNNLLSHVLANHVDIYLKSEFLKILPHFIQAIPESHQLDKIKHALRQLDAVLEATTYAILIKIPALSAKLTLSQMPKILDCEPGNLLHQMNQALDALGSILKNPHNKDMDLAFKSVGRVLDYNLIPCLPLLTGKQQFAEVSRIFNVLKDILKRSSVGLIHKWHISKSIEHLLKFACEDSAPSMMDKTYTLLQKAFHKSNNKLEKISILRELPLVDEEIVAFAAEGILRILDAVVNDSKCDVMLKFEAIGGIFQVCDQISKSPLTVTSEKMTLEILHSALGNTFKDFNTLLNLYKLVKLLPSKFIDEIANAAINTFLIPVMDSNPESDKALVILCIDGIKTVLKTMTLYQEFLFDKVFSTFRIVIFEFCQWKSNPGIVLESLPDFIKIVEGCGNKIITALCSILQMKYKFRLHDAARLSISYAVEYSVGPGQYELAKKALEIFISADEDYLNSAPFLYSHSLSKIIKALPINESVHLLDSDYETVRAAASSGILDRLNGSDASNQTDQTQIPGLLHILDCVKEQKCINEKELYSKALTKIQQIIENAKENELNSIIADSDILTDLKNVESIAESLNKKLVLKMDTVFY